MPDPDAHYDYIIAGAGAAGLSLLWHLLQQNTRGISILVVDKFLEPDTQKTWCFWDLSEMPFDQLIYKSWPSMQVRANRKVYHQILRDYQYHCIRSVDYTSRLIEIAEKHPAVTLLKSEITSMKYEDDRAIVVTSSGSFSANWGFQSVLHNPGESNNHTELKQHFVGCEIQTAKPVFDSDTIHLMDFDVPQPVNHGLAFCYVLPFSKQHALVEYTLFSSELYRQSEYETVICQYLNNRFDLTDGSYSIIRREKGAIPMRNTKSQPWYNSRILNLGITGGLTKPTTGYTFTRIHRHSRQIASALQKGNPPVPMEVSSYRYRLYDLLLLDILRRKQKDCITIFDQLFGNQPFDRVLRFLEEKSSFSDECVIFSRLPYSPFLRSLIRNLKLVATNRAYEA